LLIMLASVGYRGDAKRMAEAGYAAYLMKPDLPSHLFDALSAAWGARKEGISTGLITRHTLAESRASKISSTQRPPHAKQTRVLVAEDHAVNQKLAARTLEILGCSVDLAVNGAEAVGKAEKSVYDLVFMDCQMPGMDGYQATLEIRQREPRSRHIPIIAMTAHTMEGTRERCLGSGMDDYITKPFQKEDFERMLEKWVPRKREQGKENER
jgi:two-component system sensor histidine kinase/response regulator